MLRAVSTKCEVWQVGTSRKRVEVCFGYRWKTVPDLSLLGTFYHSDRYAHFRSTRRQMLNDAVTSLQCYRGIVSYTLYARLALSASRHFCNAWNVRIAVFCQDYQTPVIPRFAHADHGKMRNVPVWHPTRLVTERMRCFCNCWFRDQSLGPQSPWMVCGHSIDQWSTGAATRHLMRAVHVASSNL